MVLLIDVDGVMADSHKRLTLNLQTKGYNVSVNDIDHWDFGTFRRTLGMDFKEILDILCQTWRTDWERIPAVDDNVLDVVRRLLGTYESEIVTANPEPNVKNWLELKGVPTDRFHVYDGKEDLGHSVFVEDNPTIPIGDEMLVLRDRPWNRERGCSARVYDSSELLGVLEGRGLRRI